ncbi:MAG TPA: sugar ABC transporter permease [Firmicutes bacterium]|nr:sugar ABC transporter permease [Bacillota bacterium]
MVKYWGEKSLRRTKDYLGNFLFILPVIIFFSLFSLYPILRTIHLSLFKWDGMSPNMEWVGLRNFRIIFSGDPQWWISLGNAFKLAFIAVVVMQSFSLLLAFLVERGAKAEGLYKVVYYIPTILSPLVVGYIWKWIFDPYGGIINYLLEVIGLGTLTRAWLSDPVFSLLAVSVSSMWSGFGYSFLLFLAGLKGISREIIESAMVDGANGRQILLRIVVPILRPVITVVTILTVLGAMQMFPLVVAMTNGGPGFSTQVPVMTIYNECFRSHNYGYASALSTLFGLVLLILSMLQIEAARRNN